LNALRLGGFALLSLAVTKVFLYDLSTLESLWRVLSFVAPGLLLLAGALAYRRMQPPGSSDLSHRGDRISEPVQALAADRANPALGACVGVRRLNRRADDAGTF
jgi:hypothetical protein